MAFVFIPLGYRQDGTVDEFYFCIFVLVDNRYGPFVLFFYLPHSSVAVMPEFDYLSSFLVKSHSPDQR